MRCIVVVGDNRSHRLCGSNVPHVSLFLVVAVNSNERPLENWIVEVRTERVVAKVQKHVGSVILHPNIEVFRDPWGAGLQRESRNGDGERSPAPVGVRAELRCKQSQG